MARRKKRINFRNNQIEAGGGLCSVCLCVHACVCVAFPSGSWGLLPLQESSGQLHCPSYRDTLEALGRMQTQWLSWMCVYVCVCVCVCELIVSILQSRPGDQV